MFQCADTFERYISRLRAAFNVGSSDPKHYSLKKDKQPALPVSRTSSTKLLLPTLLTFIETQHNFPVPEFP